MQIFIFSWDIRRSDSMEPAFLLGNAGLGPIAAGSLDRAWTLKLATGRQCCVISLTLRTRVRCHYLNVLLICKTCLALTCMWLFNPRAGWNRDCKVRAILPFRTSACEFSGARYAGWCSFEGGTFKGLRVDIWGEGYLLMVPDSEQGRQQSWGESRGLRQCFSAFNV